jgi:hypothetical protein
MKILILICSLFLSKNHLPQDKAKIGVPIRTIAIDSSRYTVLKLDRIPDYIFDKSYKTVELSADDISKIEILIGNRVRKYNKTAKKLLIKDPSKYYKQFIAVTNANGEKEVWVNCFCEVFPQNFQWKKHIFFVFDGGGCFFQLKINLTKNTLYDLTINGVG